MALAFARTGAGLALTLVFLVAGCAVQSPTQAGRTLMEQGQTDAGLQALETLARSTPNNVEYKTAFLTGQRLAAQSWLAQAQARMQRKDWVAAASLLERVLTIYPDDDLARRGLQRVRQQERVARTLEQGQQAAQAKDWESARSYAQAVLRDDATHLDAQALQATALEKIAIAANSTSALSKAFRQPISLEFRDASVRQIFESLARGSGLNFVLDKDIKPELKASLLVRNTTIEEALNLLLVSNQLEKQVVNANTIIVFPNTPGKLKDYQELNVRTFPLMFSEAKGVGAAIKTLFKGRDVVVDDKLNALIARDTPEMLDLLERLVATYDVPESEVMLELEVLEVARDRLETLGIKWPTALSLSPLASASGVGLTLADLQNLNASTTGVGLGGLQLNAEKKDTDVNLLANPRIRVLSREKAKIMIGDKIPVLTAVTTPQGGSSETVTYMDVGLKLEVEPVIYRGNDVTIKLGLEVSNALNPQKSNLGSTYYTIGTRNATTVLRLHDGENQVLAGLINNEDRKTADKVPGLGDLPGLKRIFGSSADSDKRSEIVLSITPRIVRNSQRPEGRFSEFRTGTESRALGGGSALAAPVAPAAPNAPVAPLVPPSTAAPVPEAPPATDKP
ncbi:MAG: tetratricopeptide repeat protein [Rhodoferax sp.]|nr:tetratricopeptide repeat protein [Rhodoferax sp.]